MEELDIVAYINVGDVFEKKGEKYAQKFPAVTKMLTAVKNAVSKIAEEYQVVRNHCNTN